MWDLYLETRVETSKGISLKGVFNTPISYTFIDIE